MDLEQAVKALLSAAVVGPNDHLVIALRRDVSEAEFEHIRESIKAHPLGQHNPPRVLLVEADQVFAIRPGAPPEAVITAEL